MRTSNLTDRKDSGIKIITQVQTQFTQVKKAITQTIVAKKREEVRDGLREAGDRARYRAGRYSEASNFHLDFFLIHALMNYEVSTRSKSRPLRVQKNCQRQEASCKHAESRPIHIVVNGKTPERTFAG